MSERQSQLLSIFAAITAVVLVALQSGLPAETFLAGDSGVKLVATRNVLLHPTRPFEIPLPTIGGESVSYVEPFYRVHGQHSHAVTPEAFVLASAPYLGWIGLRAVYVLPAVGALIAVIVWTWIGLTLSAWLRPTLLFLIAAFGTPWIFYGLEFWEHAPALGMAALATLLFVRGVSGDESWPKLLGAGVCFALSTLFRPEAGCYLFAVSAAWLALNPWRWRPVLLMWLAVFTAMAPWAYYTFAHFGTLASPHLGGLGSVFREGWWSSRGHLITTWFVVPSTSNAWWIAPTMVCALIPIRGVLPSDWRRFLWLTSGLTIAAVIAIAPNDGGAQWGPRYLLLAYGPLVPLAADVLQAMARRGTVGVILMVVTLIGGAWIQRAGYRDLRGTKETYARMVTFVRANAFSRGYVVTDLWWLDQVTASIENLTFLYAPTAETAAEVLDRLARARQRDVTVVAGAESSVFAGGAVSHPCYREGQRNRIEERGLVAISLSLGACALDVGR